MDIKEEVKQQVAHCLKKYPMARDSDPVLMAYWARHYLPKGNDTTLREYLKLVHERKAPAIESVTRLRRKLQEEHPELRGNLHEDKRQNETMKVKRQLGYHRKNANAVR
jgi:hypothetical protein